MPLFSPTAVALAAASATSRATAAVLASARLELPEVVSLAAHHVAVSTAAEEPAAVPASNLSAWLLHSSGKRSAVARREDVAQRSRKEAAYQNKESDSRSNASTQATVQAREKTVPLTRPAASVESTTSNRVAVHAVSSPRQPRPTSNHSATIPASPFQATAVPSISAAPVASRKETLARPALSNGHRAASAAAPATAHFVAAAPATATTSEKASAHFLARQEPLNASASPRLPAHLIGGGNASEAAAAASADACSCEFRGICSCQASIEFMDCIAAACNSGRCDCYASQFEHACTSIAGVCTSLDMQCSSDRAACLVEEEAELRQKNRTDQTIYEELMDLKEKRCRLEIAVEDGWLNAANRLRPVREDIEKRMQELIARGAPLPEMHCEKHFEEWHVLGQAEQSSARLTSVLTPALMMLGNVWAVAVASSAA